MKIESNTNGHNHDFLFPDSNKRIIIPSTEIKKYGLTEEMIREEFSEVNFDPDNLYSVHLARTKEGRYIPAHYEVDFTGGGVSFGGQVALEKGYTDGSRRSWASRIFVFPESLNINGLEIPIPTMFDDIGYQILTKTPDLKSITTGSRPLVRVDSVCTMSMFDGHFASGGDSNLGCDCAPQRQLAQELIWNNPAGGVSMLSPLAGRGNGTAIHAGQISIQNYCKRHNLPIPPTYDTHEGQGAPKDSRPLFYVMDALLLRALGLTDIELITNNPDKIRAVENVGIKVTARDLHVPERESYYFGANFQQKVVDGGHTQIYNDQH